MFIHKIEAGRAFDDQELSVEQLTMTNGFGIFSIRYSKYDEKRHMIAVNQECLVISY